ncbi:MAG: hypothetical protein GY851_28580 [bacterium]|nr:hypothetical protein [bacterium]
MKTRIFAFAGLMMICATATALQFEDRCSSTDQWDVLDLGKSEGAVRTVRDLTCPPGYGPEVLEVKGDYLLLMAKGGKRTDGTYLVLYRENDPENRDGDGVLSILIDYPMDVEKAHNLKEKRPYVWFQQDVAGVQLRHVDEKGAEESLAKDTSVGKVDAAWNRTGWIWQKVRVDGNRIRGKFWAATEAEPSEWIVEADYDGSKGKRFGVRTESGDIRLAYFAFDPKDIPTTTPEAFLHCDLPQVLQGRRIPFALFTNASKATATTFDVAVTQDGQRIGAGSFEAKIDRGPGAHTFLLWASPEDPGFDGPVIALDREAGEGLCTVELTAKKSGFDAQRSVTITPMEVLQTKLDQTATTAAALADALADAQGGGDEPAILLANAQAASAHAIRAIDLFQGGQVDEARRSLNYAHEVFAELMGYKGEWLARALPGQASPDASSFELSALAGAGKGIRDFYTMDYLLAFGAPKLSAASAVMGRSIRVEVPWRVEGSQPDRDFTFQFVLESPLGNRIVASASGAPETPTSKWQPGREYTVAADLKVVPESPASSKKLIAEPVVLDETHRLLVTVTDPKSGGHLILKNAPGPQNHRMGDNFLVADVYVASMPVEVLSFAPAGGCVLEPREETASIANAGDTPRALTAVFSATSPSGRLLHQEAHAVQVDAGKNVPVTFKWTPDMAGDVDLRLRVLHEKGLATQVERRVSVALPEGMDSVRVVRGNHVEQDGDRFHTPLTATATPAAPMKVTVRARDRIVGQGESESGTVAVEAEPWFGYYDVCADFGDFAYETRLVATVVETAGMDVVLNGEPFLVKGTNVHSLSKTSPAFTETMMRTMRELGFNTWRTDYPARWQVDLAYELNTAYAALAPFSCTTTTIIYGRQDGPPLATARELSRVFIERYRDAAGLLFWNSGNEIRGDTADFLLSMYPLYRALDPYDRPVHYANLIGQEYWQGQDIMGMNWYFWKGRTAEGRQPDVLSSIAMAKAHDMPVFYNEFNSWHGAVQTSGVEAFEDMYVWGIEQGMVGGYQYQVTNNDRHPGLMDSDCNTHSIHNEAIIRAFADAEVSVKGVTGEEITLTVRNKRRFTLRNVALASDLSGIPLEPLVLGDLKPGDSAEVSVAIPLEAAGSTYSVSGNATFVTHFGFECKVPFDLLALPSE